MVLQQGRITVASVWSPTDVPGSVWPFSATFEVNLIAKLAGKNSRGKNDKLLKPFFLTNYH